MMMMDIQFRECGRKYLVTVEVDPAWSSEWTALAVRVDDEPAPLDALDSVEGEVTMAIREAWRAEREEWEALDYDRD